MPAPIDENNTCTVQGNGEGELCPHAPTRITSVQYKEMGRGSYVVTTRNSTERSHPFYNTRRKKRTCIPIRRNSIRRSGRIGQSSVRHDLAGGSKQSRGPCQRTTAQTSPRPSSWNASHYNRERTIRTPDPRTGVPQPRPKWAADRLAGGDPKRASTALTESSRLVSRQIRIMQRGENNHVRRTIDV